MGEYMEEKAGEQIEVWLYRQKQLHEKIQEVGVFEFIQRITDFLGDPDSMTDEEIMQEMRDEGMDIDAEIEKIKEIWKTVSDKVISNHNKNDVISFEPSGD